MSENIPEVPDIIKQIRMNNPDDEKKPRKIGCLTYCVVIVIMIGVLVWFNIFRPGPPLRISKETTYITEPLTADGRYVDYFAALQKDFHPPEMQTDANGYRVVFRALGDFSNLTSDFVPLQKRYEALGLDVINDQPTMTFVEPNDYFVKRYASHPEEFEEIIAAEKEKQIRKREESLREEIEEVKADPEWDEEGKAEYIAELESDIEDVRLTKEQWTEKRIKKIQADPDMAEEEKAEEITQLQSPDGPDMMGGMMGAFMDGPFEFTFEPYMIWPLLANSPKLHKNAIMQQWMEENNAALDLVVEQVKKPIFVTPYFAAAEYQLLIAMLLPDAQSVRSFARGLQTRSQIRLGGGDIDGAIDDIVACYQLGRHIEKKATLIEGLVGISIEGIADSLAYDIGETRANVEQLKRLQNELARLTPQKGFLHKLEYERYMCLDSILSVVRGASISGLSGGGGGAPIDKGISLVGTDWNTVFKKVNNAYDGLAAGTYTYSTPPMNPARLLTLQSRSGAIADIFIALFLPAVDAANEAYRRLECTMNMKRIVLAMHLYEREHGTLPPTFTIDENGKPLHSWRTLLLPYFGDETLAELYKQIKLDEPWDSEHNQQFHERNLDVYRCPSANSNNGETNYAVIVGDELLFTAAGKGQPFAKCGPIMPLLAERNDGVCWMLPDAEILQAEAETGVNYEFGNPTAMFGGGSATAVPISSNHTGGCNFGLRDGGVMFISNTIEEGKFRKFIRGEAEEYP